MPRQVHNSLHRERLRIRDQCEFAGGTIISMRGETLASLRSHAAGRFLTDQEMLKWTKPL